MDFANGPSISKALGTNCPVKKLSPSSLAFQAFCTPNPHSFLASGVSRGAHPEAVDGERNARGKMLQLTADPSHCPLKQAFDSTCVCPTGMG